LHLLAKLEIKRAEYRAQSAQLEREEAAQVIAAQSEDFAAGVSAFISKHAPQFTGR